MAVTDPNDCVVSGPAHDYQPIANAPTDPTERDLFRRYLFDPDTHEQCMKCGKIKESD